VVHQSKRPWTGIDLEIVVILVTVQIGDNQHEAAGIIKEEILGLMVVRRASFSDNKVQQTSMMILSLSLATHCLLLLILHHNNNN
jgi:hypothetical protein